MLSLYKSNEFELKNELTVIVDDTKFIVANSEHEDYTFQLYNIEGEINEIIFNSFWEYFCKQRKVRSFYIQKKIIDMPDVFENLGFIKLGNSDYSYFTGGIVYKLTEISSGIFYIGMTRVVEKFDKYWGSGEKWNSYLNKNNITKDNDHIEKIILKDDFKTPTELYEYEIESIREYCDLINGKYCITNPLCYNILTTKAFDVLTSSSCPECGGRRGHHKDRCSKSKGKCEYCGYSLSSNYHAPGCPLYELNKKCSECGGKNGVHYSFCSDYKAVKALKIKCTKSQDCQAVSNHHKKGCPHYIEKSPETGVCLICNKRNSHAEWCDNYKEPEQIICSKCGGKRGHHKKNCSDYTDPMRNITCDECKKIGNQRHKPGCTHYKEIPRCPTCKGKDGHHKIGCGNR